MAGRAAEVRPTPMTLAAWHQITPVSASTLPDRSDENIDKATVVPEGMIVESEETYLNFESGPVWPLALSPDKSQTLRHKHPQWHA